MAISPSNSFRNASDLKVLNTLRQADNFPSEMVAEAREVALDRGLLNDDSLKNISQSFALKQLAIQQLQSGQLEEIVVFNLKQKGLNAAEARKIVAQAQQERLYNNPPAARVEEKSSGFSNVWTIIIVIFLVVRLIRCAIVMGQ